MTTLDHCDELFLRYFDRWYTDRDRQHRHFKATMPDMFTVKQLVGLDETLASPLTENGQAQVSKQITVIVDAARGDWPGYLAVKGEIDIHWVEAFDIHYDRKRVAEVVARSDEKDFSCDYIILCCEFGAVISHVMRALQPRLVWYLDWPYWDSKLLDPKTENVIPVFHWAIKKMSDYGVEDDFAKKIMHCLKILNEPCNDGVV
jgi:hypothetical protein